MWLSVVIPTLNESAYLPRALTNLHSQSPCADEIIVVDAGSTDRTAEIANGFGACLVHSEPPISKQMNAGAAQARGDLLLFLHADCTLEPNAFNDLLCSMNENTVAGGAFKFEMRGNRPVIDRYLSWSGSWNARHSQIYLGDHGIFCRRTIFDEIGGFPDVALMYEFDFMRKLRARGQLIQLEKKCFASGRRFQKNGYWKTMLLMRSLRTFYRLGLPTTALERIYKNNGENCGV